MSGVEGGISRAGGSRECEGEPTAEVRSRGVVANFGSVGSGLESVGRGGGGWGGLSVLCSVSSSSNTLLPLQDLRWEGIDGCSGVALSTLSLETCFPLPFEVLGPPLKPPNAAESGGSRSGTISLELLYGALLDRLFGLYCVEMCSVWLLREYVYERRVLGFAEGMFALARAATFGYLLSIRVVATGGGADNPRMFS